MNFNFWKKKKPSPPFWKDYLDLFRQKRAKNQPIETLDFVIFDTETSGLEINTAKLLTIGAIRLRNFQIDLNDSYECRILQTEKYKTGGVTIHGIVPNQSKGIETAEAVQGFIKYIGNSILVGHNVGFDRAMINNRLYPIVGEKLKNAFLDTAKLAIRTEHLHPTTILDPSAYTLDSLCDKYGIRMHDRHTAAGDALLTGILLMKILHELKKRGVTTWRALNK